MQTMRRGGGVLPAANARGCSDSSMGSASRMPAERRKWRRVTGVFMARYFSRKRRLWTISWTSERKPHCLGFGLFQDGADFTLVGGFDKAARAVGDQPDRERAGESIRIGEEEFFELIHIGRTSGRRAAHRRRPRRALQIAHLLPSISTGLPLPVLR